MIENLSNLGASIEKSLPLSLGAIVAADGAYSLYDGALTGTRKFGQSLRLLRTGLGVAYDYFVLNPNPIARKVIGAYITGDAVVSLYQGHQGKNPNDAFKYKSHYTRNLQILRAARTAIGILMMALP